jgi:hypothetical protein
VLPLPAMGRQRNQGGAEVGHRYTRIGRSPSTWSANSTSGGPSVNWTAATRVPIASTANTTRPPKTSLKYPRSPATSVLGVYTKSSCWNGADWSVTAARTDQRVPAERFILSCAEPNDLGDPHLDVANVCGCVHGDLPCSPARRSSSPRLLRRAAPYPRTLPGHSCCRIAEAGRPRAVYRY